MIGSVICTSVNVSRSSCSRKLGLASARMIPHRVHTMRGPEQRHRRVIGPTVSVQDRPVAAQGGAACAEAG